MQTLPFNRRITNIQTKDKEVQRSTIKAVICDTPLCATGVHDQIKRHLLSGTSMDFFIWNANRMNLDILCFMLKVRAFLLKL